MENSSVLPSDAPLFPHSPIHQTFWIISLIVCCLAFVLGVAGNGLVLWVAGFRMSRTVTTVLFLNLAAADFAFTAFLPFVISSTILQPHWPFGWFLCKLLSFLAVLNMFASVFLLTLVALDRCVSVLWPIWARNHRKPRLAALAAAGVWIFAFAFSLPTFIFRTTDTEDEITFCYMEFDPWDEAGEDEESVNALYESRHWSLVLTRFSLGFLIPLLIISVCYGLITAKLWSGMRRVRSSRPFRILTAVVVAFFLCWLPHPPPHHQRLLRAHHGQAVERDAQGALQPALPDPHGRGGRLLPLLASSPRAGHGRGFRLRPPSARPGSALPEPVLLLAGLRQQLPQPPALRLHRSGLQGETLPLPARRPGEGSERGVRRHGGHRQQLRLCGPRDRHRDIGSVRRLQSRGSLGAALVPDNLSSSAVLSLCSDF
uniref:G-protein coupled receptors family 1 profile domain-containing protein n=1 Tax=Sarcophilus harrisii TaxID=9305 RepID=A0A7N4PQ55_SARHA